MGSNNTAELQAILEALLLLPFLPAHTSAITLHTDSKYAYDLLLGLAIPSANPQLANLLLATFTHITSQMPVAVVKVKGHSGNLGNDRADSNAARGTTSSSNLGRYASFPPSPPILPPDPLTRWFSSLPLPAQTDHLVSSLLNAANVSFSRKPASIRKPYLSVSTQQEISNLNSGTLNASDVATLRRQIRSHAARDKKRWTLRQLDIDHRSSPADRWKTIGPSSVSAPNINPALNQFAGHPGAQVQPPKSRKCLLNI